MEQDVTFVDRSLGLARDFDERPDLSWVALFERFGGLHVETSLGTKFPLSQTVRYPMIRAIGYDRVPWSTADPFRVPQEVLF
jgi:hypothetical protein